MKLFCTVLVFMLLSLVNPIFSQYPSEFEIDSLRTVFNNSNFEDSVRLGALYKIRNEVKDTSTINSAIEIAKKLEDSVKIKGFDKHKFGLMRSDSLWAVWSDNKISDSLRLDAIIEFSKSFFLFQSYKLEGEFEQFRLLIENDTSYMNLAYEFAKSKGYNKQIVTILKNKQDCYFFNGGNVLEIIKCLKKAIYYIKLLKDSKKLAQNYNSLGWMYYQLSNYERALYFCKKSISISTEFDYSEQLSHNYNLTARIYKAQNNNQKAKEYYEKSLKLNENFFDPFWITKELANLCFEDKDFKRALELYNSCIKFLNERDSKDDFGIVEIYTGIANTYRKMNLHVKALEYYDKSFNKVREENVFRSKYYYHEVWLSIIEYYHSLDNLQKTNQYINEYLNLWPSHIKYLSHWKTKKANGLIRIADIQADNGEFNNAIKNLKRAKDLSKESLAIETEKRASFSLYKFYKSVGNQKNALLLHEAYVQLSDSLSKIDGIEKEKQNEIKEYFKLQNQADSIKRAEEIILHQAEAKTQKQRNNGLVLITIIILVSLGLVYTQLKKVKKGKLLVEERNIVIEEKQKEITCEVN